MAEQTSISALTGELVIYRDLQPCDPAVPGLIELRETLCLPQQLIPRKRDAAYARVILHILHYVQQQRKQPPLQGLLVVGDTENDQQMAARLREVSGLPVYAFIGVDQLDTTPALAWDHDTATANRWALIDEWTAQIARRNAFDGEIPWTQTALLLDIDKTLLGPRGRNDEPINTARAGGALKVAHDLLSPDLDIAAFQAFYQALCRTDYHSLTRDNQDYVVYITLLLTSGVLSTAELRAGMNDGRLSTFPALLSATAPHIPPDLADLHAAIQAADAAGDPTPFKAFRHAEFVATVSRMADGRLTLCREVLAMARTAVQGGALCLAASDKPAEASLPTLEQAAWGLLPLHQTLAQVG